MPLQMLQLLLLLLPLLLLLWLLLLLQPPLSRGGAIHLNQRAASN